MIGRKMTMVSIFGALLLLLSSCLSEPVKFDDNLPQEQSCYLFFYSGLEITSYNGINVPVKRKMGVTISSWRHMYLPPGEMEFIMDVIWKYGSIAYTAKDVIFKYNFEKGNEYTMTFGISDGKWGLDVYNQKPPNVGWPRKDKHLAFVPFYKAGI